MGRRPRWQHRGTWQPEAHCHVDHSLCDDAAPRRPPGVALVIGLLGLAGVAHSWLSQELLPGPGSESHLLQPVRYAVLSGQVLSVVLLVGLVFVASFTSGPATTLQAAASGVGRPAPPPPTIHTGKTELTLWSPFAKKARPVRQVVSDGRAISIPFCVVPSSCCVSRPRWTSVSCDTHIRRHSRPQIRSHARTPDECYATG